MTAQVTFDGAPPEGTINFGVGQPSADLLPGALLGAAAASFHAGAEAFDFNYGQLAGDSRFIASLAGFLTAEYQHEVAAESLMVTAGNSQALDYVCTMLTGAGDTIFVEEPSYFLAFQIFRDHGLKLVSIPTDANGIDVERLEAALKKERPRLLYTIPSYHNPCGTCLSAERRSRLAQLSLDYDFTIVADEVYQLLYFGKPPPAAMGTYVDSGNIISLGSFSKILAPALRLGWSQSSDHLQELLQAGGMVNSGGSMNHYASHVVRTALDSGAQANHLRTLRSQYTERVAAMDAALSEHFAKLARWHCPQGGYFFWLELSGNVDTSRYRERAAELETGFQPGSVFSNTGEFSNCMRLSFAHYSPVDIAQGMRRLRRVFA